MTNFFRLVAILEGISFLVLVGIGMPLKYIFDLPETVQIVGMAHGILFILYNILVLLIREDQRWGFKKTLIAMLLSIVPLGTFFVERMLKKK